MKKYSYIVYFKHGGRIHSYITRAFSMQEVLGKVKEDHLSKNIVKIEKYEPKKGNYNSL